LWICAVWRGLTSLFGWGEGQSKEVQPEKKKGIHTPDGTTQNSKTGARNTPKKKNQKDLRT